MKYEKRMAACVVTALALVYFVFFSCLGLMRFAAYDYSDFDLALKAQILEAALCGSMEQTIVDLPFYANHANWIVFLALPFYMLWGVRSLIVAQVFFHAVALLPLYLLARRRLPAWPSVFVVVAFLHYPALVGGQLFEVHPETWCIPFLIAGFLAVELNRLRLFLACCIGAMLCKENVPATVVALVVYTLLYKWPSWKRQLCEDGVPLRSVFVLASRWLILPLCLATVYFAAVMLMKEVASAESGLGHGGAYAFLFENHELDGPLPSPGDVAMIFVRHPVRCLKRIIEGPGSAWRLQYLVRLFGPVLFLPLIAPLALIVSLPSLLQHVFSGRPTEWSLAYHYNATIIPGVFVSVIHAVQRFGKLAWGAGPTRAARNALFLLPAMAVAGTSIAVNIFLSRPPIGHGRFDLTYSWLAHQHRLSPDARDRVRDCCLELAPACEPTLATFRFLSHLADSRYPLYSMHFAQLGIKAPGYVSYTLPDATRVAMIEFDDPLNLAFWRPRRQLPDGRTLPGADSEVRRILSGHGGKGSWRRRFQVNAIGLFTHPDVELSGDPGASLDLAARAAAVRKPLGEECGCRFDGGVCLEAVHLPTAPWPCKRAFPVELNWKLPDVVPNYWVRWYLVPRTKGGLDYSQAWVTDTGPAYIEVPEEGRIGQKKDDELYLAPEGLSAREYAVMVVVYDRERLALGMPQKPPLGQTIEVGSMRFVDSAL